MWSAADLKDRLDPWDLEDGVGCIGGDECGPCMTLDGQLSWCQRLLRAAHNTSSGALLANWRMLYPAYSAFDSTQAGTAESLQRHSRCSAGIVVENRSATSRERRPW